MRRVDCRRCDTVIVEELRWADGKHTLTKAYTLFPARGARRLMLSLTGMYGLSAYTVSRRTREIGIRVAIGARPAQVLRFVFGRIGTLVTAGAMVELALGVAAADVLASIVHQASSRDPIVIVAAVVSISLVALGAAAVPARRAMRVDPVQCLRQE
jgi:ABC-type antimicrobial peptide transport system permease subunit